MTVEEIFWRLRDRYPFAHSRYERAAEQVYVASLRGLGEGGYVDLEDALEDWRLEYEQDLLDVAHDIAKLPEDAQALWADTSPEGAPER